MIRCPHWRKENQCVMNHEQSTSISGKHHPENHKGGRGTHRMRGKSKATLEAHRVASVSLVLTSYVSACGKGISTSEPGR